MANTGENSKYNPIFKKVDNRAKVRGKDKKKMTKACERIEARIRKQVKIIKKGDPEW